MSYNVRSYRVEITIGPGVSGMSAEGTATETQTRLREIRQAIDPSWAPPDSISIWSEGVRCLRYTWEDNEEDLSCPRIWEDATRSLAAEWIRLLRAIRIEMGRRRITEWLHRATVELDHGGILTEDDLREEGLHRGGTKSRPGYVPKNRSLAESLEVYTGAYGVGLIEHIPRYDTRNFHFVQYWLYDLEEVKPV